MATAKKQKPSDTQLVFTKISRVLTYLVYAYTIIAITFLSIGFVLLLFGANPNTAFTKFVYEVATEFLAPFRGIFPLRQISENSYFSGSILFAIIIYAILAMSLHALISYITTKLIKHEAELEELQQ